MSIHPTAIIDPGANIHESVEIGPYMIIENDVEIGEGCVFHGMGRIHSGTTIGKRNEFFHGVILGGLPQHLAFDPATKTRLVIGDDNVVRESVTMHRAFHQEVPTTVGNNNYIMGFTHVGHDCVLSDGIILTQGALLAGHCIIGKKVVIGGLAGIHQFSRVGDYAMIGSSSKINRDVPPFCMVDGNPAWITGLNLIGLRRAEDMDKNDIRDIKAAYKTLYRSGLTQQAALDKLKSESPSDKIKYMVQFFEESERGMEEYMHNEAEPGL